MITIFTSKRKIYIKYVKEKNMKKLTYIVSMFLFSLLVECTTSESVQMIEYENIETEVFKIEETETEDEIKDDKENQRAWLDKI